MRIARLAALGAAAWLALAGLPGSSWAEPNPAPAPQVRSSGDTFTYVVRQNDTLRSIAGAHLERESDWRALQTLNGVADPLRLPVGTTLRLPVALLKTRPVQARLVSFRGDVSLRQGGAVTTRVGATVGEGAEIETGANANARFTLPDGGTVSVPSMSRVRLTRLRAYVLNGAVDQEITVLGGRSEFRVSPVRSPGGFRVGTPLSASAVRGTEFRIGYDGAADRAQTEVLGGSVHVTPEGLEPLIAAPRQGVAIADGKADLVDLLPEPAWVPDNAIQAGGMLSFAVTPVVGAARYRAVVATDADFVNIVSSGESRPGETTIDIYPLPDGPYFVRLTAVSPLDLEGMPADYRFVRALNVVSGLSVEPQAGGGRAFHWSTPPKGAESYRFQLARADGTLVADRTDVPRPGIILPPLPSGEYRWRVMSVGRVDGKPVEAWSPPASLTVP
ncbi:FecR domain-containing protein [Brevundimonas goettingensis]|uniref:FecR domain-containing protein n=1 Tax=Brevundimonas goettingensis TaxID=2774190 RepID=A0A975C1H2_9CAUL|nr:FecR domain-containing protein [Brevundimonas goettingensis]QTC89842.1 FecR domain-containing protein [Brevundimonas goettingensis]